MKRGAVLTAGCAPTAAGARLVFTQTLTDHRDRLAQDHRPSVLAQNVVTGADESWFDYWTLGTAASRFKEYELRVRRGSLLVGIVLSGLRDKGEKDPRTVLTGLAGLVLSRIPNVGRADTGKLSMARFSVAAARAGPGRSSTTTRRPPRRSRWSTSSCPGTSISRSSPTAGRS